MSTLVVPSTVSVVPVWIWYVAVVSIEYEIKIKVYWYSYTVLQMLWQVQRKPYVSSSNNRIIMLLCIILPVVCVYVNVRLLNVCRGTASLACCMPVVCVYS